MTAPVIDLAHLEAATVLLPIYDHLRLVLVGCGGTGSHCAEPLARIGLALRDLGKDVQLTFIDPDVVEERNVPRQLFTGAEIGLPKAATLAWRYNAAWGMDIRAIVGRLEPEHIPLERDQLTLFVGAVDNGAARRAIAEIITNRANRVRTGLSRTWWLDAGNWVDSGQVLIGSHTATDDGLRDAFATAGICSALPAPSLVAPDLIAAEPEDDPLAGLSCADLARRNAQSLAINHSIASVVGQYLVELLLTGGLRQFRTYINLAAKSMRSDPVTRSSVAQAIGQPVNFFTEPQRKKGN